MSEFLTSVAVGLGAGTLSGAFGVGGGVLTTPAVRLLLGYPALIAVGTPLVAVVPAAVVGAVAHARSRGLDVRGGLIVGAWGSLSAIAGAHVSALVGGTTVMIATAAVIVWAAFTMFSGVPAVEQKCIPTRRNPVPLAVLGLVTGAYSGLLGLGGGVILVPLLHRYFGYDIKAAIGTSLVAISVLAVPGSIAHWWLGHVDVSLAIGLSAGAVPGALVGSRLVRRASDRGVRLAFACLLVVVGLTLALGELGVL